MKFETKIGLGEIVHYTRVGHPKAQHDELLEVTVISFDKEGAVYHCRYPSGITSVFREEDLIGDSDFNQETGEYPYDITGEDTKFDLLGGG